MDKKNIFGLSLVVVAVFFVFLGITIVHQLNKSEEVLTNQMDATIMWSENDELTVQDSNHMIYTFLNTGIEADVGSSIHLEYTGVLNRNQNIQDGEIVSYEISPLSYDENGISTDWLDHGIFSNYYILASRKLKDMTLDEKIAQLLLVRYPDKDAVEILKKYQFGGYVFFEKDFKDKMPEEVQGMMAELQDVSKIPILTAVDEEGGSVVRVSSNPKLRSEKFKSSQELYKEGGFDLIKKDTVEKSNLLHRLGINLNLAPVIDVSTNSSDYMYNRSIGQNTEVTSTYAKTVVEASKDLGVSYVLKHFPGYGNNDDTHYDSSVDNRSYEDLLKITSERGDSRLGSTNK